MTGQVTPTLSEHSLYPMKALKPKLKTAELPCRLSLRQWPCGWHPRPGRLGIPTQVPQGFTYLGLYLFSRIRSKIQIFRSSWLLNFNTNPCGDPRGPSPDFLPGRKICRLSGFHLNVCSIRQVLWQKAAKPLPSRTTQIAEAYSQVVLPVLPGRRCPRQEPASRRPVCRTLLVGGFSLIEEPGQKPLQTKKLESLDHLFLTKRRFASGIM